MMLSLPEDWNYTTRGLAKICKEGVDAIDVYKRQAVLRAGTVTVDLFEDTPRELLETILKAVRSC